jgi:class 3 adenylate cyclase
MSDLPSGTVTFLFTDIEGSTRLWESHPEAMQRALARHDELLRSAVESEYGHVVKTTGDGLHAAFADATRAVQAAVRGQRELALQSWKLPEPLRVLLTSLGRFPGVPRSHDDPALARLEARSAPWRTARPLREVPR